MQSVARRTQWWTPKYTQSSCFRCQTARAQRRAPLAARAAASKEFDYDLIIIGCGVGGHGAALHAVESVSRLNMRVLTCQPQDGVPVLMMYLAQVTSVWRCLGRA
jgi:6-phosphogluconolactonase/glucosamine-6-phosphate isomerase/deaminase